MSTSEDLYIRMYVRHVHQYEGVVSMHVIIMAYIQLTATTALFSMSSFGSEGEIQITCREQRWNTHWLGGMLEQVLKCNEVGKEEKRESGTRGT